ncbi:MAG: DUF4145 domain-containing protein [Bacteroidales bacterium]|nr:DUF4145 domain-containing protein [Bacteroidales bacterium]
MSNEISIREQVHTCYNCGNTGILKFKSSIQTEVIDGQADDENDISELIEHTNYFLFECPVCNYPIIIREYQYDIDPESFPEIRTIFPTPPLNGAGIPFEIQREFDAAVKTKGIDRSICLLSLRRVLEIVCKDKKASGKTLEQKIESLVISGILPAGLNDACWIIRQLGNTAAHGDKQIFSEHQTEQVISFVSVVIEYLYSLPVRIASLKNEIINRNSTP